MSTTSTTTSSAHPTDPGAAPRRTWAAWGVAAGLLGVVGTLVTDVRPDGKRDGDSLVTPADMAGLGRDAYHVGVVAGYAAVAALLVFAALWRTWAERTAPRSGAARVVDHALVAAAGGLALGYGFKGAMAIYLPGGSDAGGYGPDGLFVYYMLNDFGAYLGWMPAMVAAGAVVWLAFRDRLVARWLGVVSALAVLPPLVFLLVTGLPGFPGVVGGAWLTVLSAGLLLGRRR